ncbi:MAG: hypothetical protein MUC73_05465 [Cyclobacteriaceae bacterium]|nr:hypothetical protein [Cyclobacteriaceae bacterium]
MKKILYSTLLVMVLVVMSCRDESLYPLPYDDRTSGAYLRMYSIVSNVFDLNDLNNSGFEVTWESVDANGGRDLAEVIFYVSHRRGISLTDEVEVARVPASAFQPVPEPTGSVYTRATARITANQVLAALNTITADPDGADGLVGFPGDLLAADQIVFRWVQVLNDGRTFSVLNPQASVNSAFAKTSEANMTPNITGGQFYSAPYIYTVVVRSLVADSWTGDFSLTQNAIWSPSHSAELHSLAFPAELNQVLFPDQSVTLSKVPGGLSTERQFNVNYRGENVTMRINLENGTVWIPVQNSTVDCTAERELYWTMPTTGSFSPGSFVLPPGLPQATTPNRGSYSTTAGLTAGDVLTIGVDDDADEYGRRNGYCSWTLRVRLTLTKL